MLLARKSVLGTFPALPGVMAKPPAIGCAVATFLFALASITASLLAGFACPSQIVSPKSRFSSNKFEQSPGPRRRRRTLQYQTSRPPDHTSSQALAEAPHARARLWTRQRLAPSHAARWQPTHRRIGCRQAVCLQLCPASVLIRKEVGRVLCTWSSACPSLEHAPAPACSAMDASLWSNALRRRQGCNGA